MARVQKSDVCMEVHALSAVMDEIYNQREYIKQISHGGYSEDYVKKQMIMWEYAEHLIHLYENSAG